jgi:hypothetical protein
MTRAGVLLAVISMLFASEVQAQTPVVPGPCEGNQDTCNSLQGHDAAASGASGGIGSRKGTGGAGTNAIRPLDVLGNSPQPLPPAKLPGLPRRFGF